MFQPFKRAHRAETPDFVGAEQAEIQHRQRQMQQDQQNALGAAQMYNSAMGDKSPIADWMYGNPANPATSNANTGAGAQPAYGSPADYTAPSTTSLNGTGGLVEMPSTSAPASYTAPSTTSLTGTGGFVTSAGEPLSMGGGVLAPANSTAAAQAAQQAAAQQAATSAGTTAASTGGSTAAQAGGSAMMSNPWTALAAAIIANEGYAAHKGDRKFGNGKDEISASDLAFKGGVVGKDFGDRGIWDLGKLAGGGKAGRMVDEAVVAHTDPVKALKSFGDKKSLARNLIDPLKLFG
jgi:hypothetical protein